MSQFLRRTERWPKAAFLLAFVAIGALASVVLWSGLQAATTHQASAEPGVALPGDANCDELVGPGDAKLVLEYAAGLSRLLLCPGNADINGDGHTDPIDASLILQPVRGLLTLCPTSGCPTAIETPPPDSTATPVQQKATRLSVDGPSEANVGETITISGSANFQQDLDGDGRAGWRSVGLTVRWPQALGESNDQTVLAGDKSNCIAFISLAGYWEAACIASADPLSPSSLSEEPGPLTFGLTLTCVEGGIYTVTASVRFTREDGSSVPAEKAISSTARVNIACDPPTPTPCAPEGCPTATPPKDNDDFASAKEIREPLPFSNEQDITSATLEPDEPQPCGNIENTAWYSFTPSEELALVATAVASPRSDRFGTAIATYTGDSLASLSNVDCVQGAFGTSVRFLASPETTYYFQVGGAFGEPGELVFKLETVPRMSLGASGNVACDAIRPSKCTATFVPSDPKAGEFQITVNAHTIPAVDGDLPRDGRIDEDPIDGVDNDGDTVIDEDPPGYSGAASEVLLGGLGYNQRAECADEVVWPDQELCLRFIGAAGQLQHGGVTDIIPPFRVSTHEGALVELDVRCPAAGAYEVLLTALPIAPFGATYVDENGIPAFVFAAETRHLDLNGDGELDVGTNFADTNGDTTPDTSVPKLDPATGESILVEYGIADSLEINCVGPTATPCSPAGCPTATITPSPTVTPTVTITPSPTETPTVTITPSPTVTPTPGGATPIPGLPHSVTFEDATGQPITSLRILAFNVATLTAVVLDSLGRPVADGTPCTFDFADPGQIALLTPRAPGVVLTIDGRVGALLGAADAGNLIILVDCEEASGLLPVQVLPHGLPLPAPGGPTSTPIPSSTPTPSLNDRFEVLRQLVESLNSPPGPRNGLIGKVDSAARLSQRDLPCAAARVLGGLINNVEALGDRRIAPEEAASIVEQAQTIIDQLGAGVTCPGGRDLLAGDVTPDCVIDALDEQALAFRFGAEAGTRLYDQRFDLEPAGTARGDGYVGLSDLRFVFSRHGSDCEASNPAGSVNS